MAVKTILDQSFWQSTDVLTIAEELIGCELVSNFGERQTAGIIVETEAYRGRDDKACHAYNGKRTLRTEILYGPPGRAYIYLCYGIHHLLNFVCGAKGSADAVLIRAVQPSNGLDMMAERRRMKPDSILLTNGPGKLAQAMGIYSEYSGIPITESKSLLKCFKLHNNSSVNIATSRRIGINYAEECVDWEWRFTMKNNKYISKRP